MFRGVARHRSIVQGVELLGGTVARAATLIPAEIGRTLLVLTISINK